MKTLTLEALRAKEGDALIISSEGVTVLIDAGPPGVYRKSVKKRLAALDNGAVQPPRINLLMVSHIDSDHIAGVLDLTQELIDAVEEKERPIVQVDEAWLNSFADTLAYASSERVSTVRDSSFDLASFAENDPMFALQMPDAKVVLESVGQGRRLRHDLARLNIDINRSFKENVVLHETAERPWQKGDLTLTVIGPGKKELDRLKKEWTKQLPKILAKERAKEAALEAARKLDESVFNLASIVAIAEVGTKKILLTGDARGDMILNWLELAGFEGGQAHFDILKIPHHGSDRNVTEEFFRRVTADHYVVSGNGKHGNPEPEMFEMLFAARQDDDFLIHMTFGPNELSSHHEFDGQGFKKVMNRGTGRRQKLRFPSPGEQSISITLTDD
jgi:beta-lactamase superfamily II metal-dependent hydrolase